MSLFENRRQAGRALAAALVRYADRPEAIVLALPRGGVPVGYEVARALRVPLDVFIVRKIGWPRNPELALGAIAPGGRVVLNDDMIERLAVSRSDIERVIASESRELERRERLYRRERPPLDVAGRVAILVDDGLATGASMRAAVAAVRALEPAKVVVAVPVAESGTCEEVRSEVDDTVCAVTPEPFHAVGAWYADFGQTTDEEVGELLARATSEQEGRARRRKARGAVIAGERSGARSGGSELAQAIADVAVPLGDAPDKLQSSDGLCALMQVIGERRCVLLGEATHGTHEFYQLRALITRRLIEEKGFTAIAVEGDWPDAYRVTRHIQGGGASADAVSSLADFKRFPAWMWRNQEVVALIRWLRAHNDRCEAAAKVGFYGLDLYSLHASIEAVLAHLDQVDPKAAERARARYACFEDFGDDPQVYGYAASSIGMTATCEDAVVLQLVELERRRTAALRKDGLAAEDEHFQAEQNARVVRSAEHYYRAMFGDSVSSWNLRDTHMADTLDALFSHLARRRSDPKIVVWAHNSHIGDARATQMGDRGELNLGQLARERHTDGAVLIGFTTYEGTVTAASNWGANAERKRVRPALTGSYEALLHQTGAGNFVLPLQQLAKAAGDLCDARLERAIGVIYKPETERFSHYFEARICDQFDAVVHVDKTRALEPLERNAQWQRGELPETYPAGL
jgi:erythromycin esterase-like protein/predicted phosphoribosyltransferase